MIQKAMPFLVKSDYFSFFPHNMKITPVSFINPPEEPQKIPHFDNDSDES